MAAAYNRPKMWDEATEAAQQALELKPGFHLARNYLQYSKSQKQRMAQR